jgi:hypothetical protein
MSSKISAAAEPAARKGLLLKCGKENNFITWKLEQIEICSVEFGFQANVLKTNMAYVPPAVVEADYVPPAEAGHAALTAASLTTLRLDAEKERNKEVRDLRLSLPKFYATLLRNVSPESKEEIKQHPDFDAADLSKDANVLWRIIMETHLTAVHGAGDSMRVFDQMALRTKFSQLKQRHGVSIGVFKQEATSVFQATLVISAVCF